MKRILQFQKASIAYEQLYQALIITRDELKDFSESLPPLVKDLEIASSSIDIPLIDTKNGNEISFHILENRKQNVKIFITVDSPSGEPIISSEYGIGESFDFYSGKGGS